MKNSALITIHGMGDTKPDYANTLIKQLEHRLAAQSTAVHFGAVYYQDILQFNEQRVWQATGFRLRWSKLRRFILFGFADAAGLEHKKEQPNSSYLFAQLKIARALYVAKQQLNNDGKVLLLAHSLGCHVISCYLWDAALARAGQTPAAGIWRNIRQFQAAISGDIPLTADDIAFLQGGALAGLITTGCNIPIFVAAHASEQIATFPKPTAAFFWHNYYDKDDVLGWPLADLSPSYAAMVKDIDINVGSGVFGWLAASWNPLSHNQYWQDSDVVKGIVHQMTKLL